MKLEVGSKVKFRSERLRYTVQASDERFAVCTKPFNPQRTVLYTIIDFQEQVRGPEDLIFGEGAETREQCEEMLDRLNGSGDPPFKSEVSHRHRIPLDLEGIRP
jgi:hypothetical protein